MITVCLLTCGRPELTAITCRSFAAFNGTRFDLQLLHVDVGSDGDAACAMAGAAGFGTIMQSSGRPGQMECFRHFAAHAAGQWVLWLENDWESVAELPPSDFFDKAWRRDISAVRLFGARKMRGVSGRAFAGQHRMGTKDRINWVPMNEWWEFGLAHWGGGGCLLTTEIFKRAADYSRLKDFMTAENFLPTLRSTENIMFHIGTETTPGFRD